LLVRATHNRAIDDNEYAYLFDAVDAQSVEKTITVTIRGKEQKTREATLEIRYTQAKIKRPKSLKKSYPELIQVSVISASEISAPDGISPAGWYLVTSIIVDSVDLAIWCVEKYALRWIIERYHFTLKSGCQIEELQLETTESIERALAVYSIVAWRLMHITYLARKDPDIPCTKVLSDDEWKALCCFTEKTTTPPKRPPTLKEAVTLIAKLGGFLARKGDGVPGLEVIWRGFRRLDDITETYKIFQK
jgi:hypothetical protein